MTILVYNVHSCWKPKHCLCLSFTDVYAGWPGSTSSASVLSRSDLRTKAEDQADGYLFPKEVSLMAGKRTKNYD